MVSFTNVYDAWEFLRNHPVRGWLDTSFVDTLDIMIVKVNPFTHRIDDDPNLNTETEVWLEAGPGYSDDGDELGALAHVPIHDHKLDSGGWTFEIALMRLADRVKEEYGS